MKITVILLLIFLIYISGCGRSDQMDIVENSIGIRLLKIDPGTFRMGDSGDNSQWDESPIHSVSISNPFYISETEITSDQYRLFRSEYEGFEKYSPYISGVSWYDATAFCQWLSEKEGKQYRLPTEAEWEYVCRAGSTTQFSSGDKLPDHETANAWGVKNMHTGVLEWCYDWYGPYPLESQKDPVGYIKGLSKVVRGGLPDDKDLIFNHPPSFYQRSTNRAAIAPEFEAFWQEEFSTDFESAEHADYDQFMPGLIGILYDDAHKKKTLAVWQILSLNSDEIQWKDLNDWSAEWRGSIIAPHSGQVTFYAQAEEGLLLEIDGKKIIDGWGKNEVRKGHMIMEKDRKYPIVLSYFKDRGNSYMRLYWSWQGQERIQIPSGALIFNTHDRNGVKKHFYQGVASKLKTPSIGFRIVQAPLPATEPYQVSQPFVFQGVRQNFSNPLDGPSLKKPYFRKRHLLPIPPENSERELIDAVSFHPLFSRHTHDPGMAVCANGDVLAVLYTSTFEDDPEVSMLALRLRYGADQWDMPSPFIDFADVNDVAPLLWNENGRLYFFWGNIHLDGMYPFQWITSENNGASWSKVNYPDFITRVGPNTPQPINSAFRDREGTIYVACDGLGATSVLYLSEDNGQTWIDTGGRSGGRHTTFVLLNDGRILGMGGKHSHVNGYMPQSLSSDRGKTWQISATPFACLGSSQRPSIIRLASGRLMMAGDFQRIDGFQPEGIKERGSYVALSEDEGKNWKIKKLPGGQGHESDERRAKMKGGTVGYSVAKQGPNGIIHLIATMTHPCLHYEFNEAWILSDENYLSYGDDRLMASTATAVRNKNTYEEYHANGQLRLIYVAGIADDGRFLKDGEEKWFYPDGRKQYQVTYQLGEKTGRESYWNQKGQKVWEWNHQPGGLSVWSQWWSNGQLKAQSYWKNKICHGIAERYDRQGKVISTVNFIDGNAVID